MDTHIKSREFGSLSKGEKVRLFELNSENGCCVSVSEYGAAITSITLLDKHGNMGEICLGYDKLDPYVQDTQFLGATVGRYANRISNSQFTLNNIQYSLEPNIPPHQIHGGAAGFHKQHWMGAPNHDGESHSVTFQRVSADGECGYPGELDVVVTYSLSKDNILTIEYRAVATKETFVSLTNHAYFNLSHRETIEKHSITIFSDFITPLDAMMLPTGEIQPVIGTPFDLNRPSLIAQGLASPSQQIQNSAGYDINYILNKGKLPLNKAAYVYDEESGRSITLKTTQPCLQFYTGNNLSGTPNRQDTPLPRHAGFCLEPQDYPNGPNLIQFPTAPLAAGQEYSQRTEYHFGF
ncbi:MAG: aldose epimerase family protein [Sneathiella sp.]